MSSMLFLLRKTVKNKIVSLKNKPGMLILYIFLIAMVGFSLVATLQMDHSAAFLQASATAKLWLELIFVAYLLLFFYIAVSKGLSVGASFFTMSDVNILFVSPISPKIVLGFGLITQTGKTLLAGLFILFQGVNLRNFGFGPEALLYIFFGFVLSVVVFELMAMAIYTLTSNRPVAKLAVKALSVLILAPTLLDVGNKIIAGYPALYALLLSIEQGSLHYIPIAGWMNEFVFGILGGNIPGGLLYLVYTLVAGGVFMMLFTMGKSDYYEDVLVATEAGHDRLQAQKEAGGLNQNVQLPKNVKVKDKDRQIKGLGARAFLSKHLLEETRQSKLFLLDNFSMSTLLACVVASWFMREWGAGSLMFALGISMYMMLFFISTSRGLKELNSHYIFLIPDKPFQKVLWSNVEVVVKNGFESVVLFLIVALITKQSILLAMLFALTKTVFALTLIAANILTMRVFGSVINRGILLVFYILFIFVAMVPGIIGGAILSFFMGPFMLGVVLTGWELLLAGVFLFFGKNVLSRIDMEAGAQKLR